jgi:hypothetical protein
VIGAASPTLGLSSIALTMLSFVWIGGWLSGSAAMIAILAGTTQDALPFTTNVITITLAVLLGWPLLTKKRVARYLSIVLKVCALATFLAALLSLVLLPDRVEILTSYSREMLTPHFDVFVEQRAADPVDLVLAITFLGLGSWASVLYTAYASLAGYGRSTSGGVWADSGEDAGALALLKAPDREGLGSWYRHLWKDVSLGVGLNLITTALLAFLSIRILFDSGREIGKGFDLLSEQARFFEPLLGGLAIPVFVLIGLAFLLDTWVGFVPLMAKGMQEGLQASVPSTRKYGEERLYQAFVLLLAIQTVLTALVTAPSNLIRLAAITLNLTHPVVIALLLYSNYYYLPKCYGLAEIRPKRGAQVLLWIALVAYSALALWYSAVTFR